MKKKSKKLQEETGFSVNDGGKSLSEILSSTTTPETKAHSSTTFQFLIKVKLD